MSSGIDLGCIRITLAVGDGRIDSIELDSDRPQVASVLHGRPADAAVSLIPLLFALCGRAQGRAAELALAAARGEGAAPRVDPAIAAEAMREHLWRWLLDLPPLLGEAPLKAEFADAMGWIAQGRRDPLARLLDDPRIGCMAATLDGVSGTGSSCVALLPGFDAAASLRFWPRLDAAFCRRPVWQGAAAETGALARRGGGASATMAMRWMARLAELRDWAADASTVGAGGTASSVLVAPGVGRALVETARGLLMHEIMLDGDSIASYFIAAPTEWNFHPHGPLPTWLAGRDATDRAALAAHVALAVATLDPCVRWELAWL